ncbi:hypothetical protein [Kitasatospora sp. NPDC088351]|uniref:hypothetical protein n=1 Tax=unclassified Kitasatospora TaxID=2633591 RepID=UPI00342EFB28
MGLTVDEPRWGTISRFARSHNVRGIFTVFALVAVCDALFGSVMLQLPYTNGGTGIPFRREIPLVFATVSVAGLASLMQRFEETATTAFRRAQLAWIAGVVALSAAVLGVEELVISSPAVAVLLTRGLLIWTGLALLSGRLFGWRLSFILPLASVFPLTYWQYDAQGRNRWWDWTNQPPTAWPCWALAVVALGIGCAAMTLTPWRAARMRSGWSMRVWARLR